MYTCKKKNFVMSDHSQHFYSFASLKLFLCLKPLNLHKCDHSCLRASLHVLAVFCSIKLVTYVTILYVLNKAVKPLYFVSRCLASKVCCV